MLLRLMKFLLLNIALVAMIWGISHMVQIFLQIHNLHPTFTAPEMKIPIQIFYFASGFMIFCYVVIFIVFRRLFGGLLYDIRDFSLWIRQNAVLKLYILRSLVTSSIIFIVVVIGLYVVMDLFTQFHRFLRTFEQMKETGLKISLFAIIVKHYFHLFPLLLYMLLPIITFISAMAVITWMERRRELLILKTSGISVYQAISVFWLYGVLCVGFMVTLQELIIPGFSTEISEGDLIGYRREYINSVQFLDEKQNRIYIERCNPYKKYILGMRITKAYNIDTLQPKVVAESERAIWQKVERDEILWNQQVIEHNYSVTGDILPCRDTLQEGDFIDLEKFLLDIKDSPDPLSRYLWNFLPEDLKDNFLKKKILNTQQTINLLNTLLEKEDLYEQGLFRIEMLESPKAVKISMANHSKEVLGKLNRLLLQKNYPAHILGGYGTFDTFPLYSYILENPRLRHSPIYSHSYWTGLKLFSFQGKRFIVQFPKGYSYKIPQKTSDLNLQLGDIIEQEEKQAKNLETTSSFGLWRLLQKNPNDASIRVTLYSRISNPISIFILLFLGFPIMLSRNNIYLSIIICTVLASCFYGFNLLCINLAHRGGIYPIYAVSLPSMVFGSLAFALRNEIST